MVKKIIDYFYGKNYKRLLILPIILFIFSIIVIAGQIITTGDFVDKSVSLKGGYTISIHSEKDFDIKNINSVLENEFPDNEVSSKKIIKNGQQYGLLLEADFSNDADVSRLVNSLSPFTGTLSKENYSVEKIGSSLGQSFFFEALITVLVAFIFMALVVFIYFKTLIPSLAVIQAAFNDILITLAVFNLLDMKLSSAGIAAFIMLIGYSVDTDILLTTRLLRKTEGTVNERLARATYTGLTMTFTAIAAVTVSLLLTNSDVIKEIMTIVLIGLFADIVFTWFVNGVIMKWYVERKEYHQHKG